MFYSLVAAQIDRLKDHQWFQSEVDKDALWELYLASFPEGTNPVYRKRTAQDCSCCKHFVRNIGGLIALKDGQVSTIWDVETNSEYQPVAAALSARLRQSKILLPYSHFEGSVGAEKTLQKLEDGSIHRWAHFHGKIPVQYRKRSPSSIAEIVSTVQVFERGLLELKDDALESVLELIAQNSLYRGAEFKNAVQGFRDLKKKYADLKDPILRNRFLWENANTHGARVRNTAIGTLLQDLSEGMDLDGAVRAYEAKVAPANYRRPTALITPRMINDALTAIRDAGLEDSLQRRFAVAEDLSVNDILFVDGKVRGSLRDVLKDSLMSEVKEKPKDFSKVQEIGIEDFLKNVVPTSSAIEVLFENHHQGNLVSLVAPVHADAKRLFKWNNDFSWSYNGNVTDSIKERVKSAGGKVDGFARVSLSWSNYDDLDLHVKEPSGFVIYYATKMSPSTQGRLDVDMNAGSGTCRDPVENVAWPKKMPKGSYQILVHQFSKRESIDVGFDIEIECGNVLEKFSYPRALALGETIAVATIVFDGERITEVLKGNPNLEQGSASKEVWGIKTNAFHKVSLMTLSPNHWGRESEGNKHYMFILDGCVNPDRARGFYNEFLPAKYDKYRKVLEVLGDKTKCEPATRQLSGLGFSSTQPNSLVCKVTGQTSRMLKVIF